MSNLSYTDIIAELESRTVMPDRVPSLETTQKALNRVLKPGEFRPNHTIVVAGTNGKGSICATLESLLISAGQRVGLYTSPHLIETTERIRLNGLDINQELFCRAYEHVQSLTSDLQLSHFEMLTTMAAWVFFSSEAAQNLDWFIFEVGLGGKWDSTNAIPHQFCGIATLGYDHQNLLGHSLVEIASNKFGIVHSHSTVVHSPLPEEIKTLASEVQSKTDSQWIKSTSFEYYSSPSEKDPRFFLKTKWGQTEIKLPGHRGAQNSATALTLFQALGFSPENHLSALMQVNWPCRMEKVSIYTHEPRDVYLSGDHNPQGIESLRELLQSYSYSHLHILVGVARDKDVYGILHELTKIPNSSIYLTQTPVRGALLDAGSIQNISIQNTFPESIDGLHYILDHSQAYDMILVTGSLYLAGYIRKHLKK